MYNNTYNQLAMLPYMTWSYSYTQPANGYVAVWEGLTVNGSPMVDTYGNAICVDYYGNALPYNMPGCRPSGVWKIYSFSELYSKLGHGMYMYAQYNAAGVGILVFSTGNFIVPSFTNPVMVSSDDEAMMQIDNLATANLEQLLSTLMCADNPEESAIKRSICDPVEPDSGISIKNAYATKNYDVIRRWNNSGNSYRWFTAAKRLALINPKCRPDINAICRILSELHESNISGFGVSPDLRSYVSIPRNANNSKAGGMYEECLNTRINYNDMPCDTERLAIAGSGSLKNALDRVSMTTGNTDYEILYNIGKESEQFLEDAICGNAIKALSSTSVSDITRLAVGFVPDTDFDVDSQKTRDWIMSGKASMWVLLEKTLLSNGQVVHGDGAHRFYYEVLGLIKAFCVKYNVIPPSPFNSNVLGTELFIMDCHLNNSHAKRLFHDMSNANRGVM